MSPEENVNRVFGIDLGTTYSCIAWVNDVGKAEVVPNRDNELTTPSVVYFETSDHVTVGQAAKEELKTNAAKVARLFKPMMGEEGVVLQSLTGEPLTPQDISSHVLRRLVSDAMEHTRSEQPIRDVVITVPAYFGFAQKEATRQAGRLAGLEVRHLIPEPTAAAIYYGLTSDISGEQTVLVYDLGGGTFDVAVIAVSGGGITAVSVAGDHTLGGADWDARVASWLADEFCREHGVDKSDLEDDDETWQEILAAAETAKRALSNKKKTRHSVRVLHGVNRSRIELTREIFDRVTEDELNQTIKWTRQAVEKAKAAGYARIDKILLVGGSTYMLQVGERLRREFPAILDIALMEPNLAVAQGAALFAHKCFLDDAVMRRIAEQTGMDVTEADLDAVPEDVRERAEVSVAGDQGMQLEHMQKLTRKQISNITGKSFGMRARWGKETGGDGELWVWNLVRAGATVPVEVTKQFLTVEAGQTQVEIVVYETASDEERVAMEDAKRIYDTALALKRAVPRGSPVEIRFRLSPDGLLSVHGKYSETGAEVDLEIKTTALLTEAELEARTARMAQISVA